MTLDGALWYESVTVLMDQIISWVNTEDTAERWWKLKAQVAEMCLNQMTDVVAANVADEAVIECLSNAIPHVRHLMIAMRQRDRVLAIESGSEAVFALQAIGVPKPIVGNR